MYYCLAMDSPKIAIVIDELFEKAREKQMTAKYKDAVLPIQNTRYKSLVLEGSSLPIHFTRHS